MVLVGIESCPNLTADLNVYLAEFSVIIENSLVYNFKYYVEITQDKSSIGLVDFTLNLIGDIESYVRKDNVEFIRTLRIPNCESFYGMLGKKTIKLTE